MANFCQLFATKRTALGVLALYCERYGNCGTGTASCLRMSGTVT